MAHRAFPFPYHIPIMKQWLICDSPPAHSAGHTCRIPTDFPIELPGSAEKRQNDQSSNEVAVKMA